MRLILEGRYRRVVLDLGVQSHDRDKPEGEGSEAMVETVGAPERPPLGFCPPSDPIRHQESP